MASTAKATKLKPFVGSFIRSLRFELNFDFYASTFFIVSFFQIDIIFTVMLVFLLLFAHTKPL